MSRKLHKSTPTHTIHINTWRPNERDGSYELFESVNILPQFINRSGGLVIYEFDTPSPGSDRSQIKVAVPIDSKDVQIDIYK